MKVLSHCKAFGPDTDWWNSYIVIIAILHHSVEFWDILLRTRDLRVMCDVTETGNQVDQE